MKNKSTIMTMILIISTLFAGCSNTDQERKMGDYNGDGIVSDEEKDSLCYQAEESGKRFARRNGEEYNPKEDFGNYESCYNISIEEND